MRKVIVSNYATLDGFTSGTSDELDWFHWNEETEQYAKEIMEDVDTILFGRVTYDLMAGYWPTPASREEDPVIRDFMNETPKLVFSRTLKEATWNDTQVIPELNESVVAELKQQTGKDMVIYGSGSVVGQITQWGLIDDYRIFVNPVVLGRGKPMFRGLAERRELVPAGTRTFSNGVVLLRYRSGDVETGG
jgi:dihydrofolate reductase